MYPCELAALPMWEEEEWLPPPNIPVALPGISDVERCASPGVMVEDIASSLSLAALWSQYDNSDPEEDEDEGADGSTAVAEAAAVLMSAGCG
ncbi:hypothetical protein PHSY_002544 [Pseudozyma hubeiensis SY62]|uniref:Uncharacterized protein n=1 Tax=Pseudozyma hubeiensis (strain SY62) TaxID=1305764 RepID=R9P177_PSEHS|nr:hypothetical protein PHSY_002544 [Pseudozyma hubeiensis SY62]GAC94971.1 hypothetical protein PHSY_002544 [Pseudozyma hubeiensis SY62]